MLLAKDVVAVEADFINVLAHIPGTKEQIQSYFSSRGIRVPRTNYEKMWEALTGRIEHGGAGSAVFDCLRENMPHPLKETPPQARRVRTDVPRTTQPAIDSGLFFP